VGLTFLIHPFHPHPIKTQLWESPHTTTRELKVQNAAHSAARWCEQKGGTIDADDMVGKISKLGTSGKHAKNCERDFHSLLKTFSKRLGAKISTIHARMYNHAEARVEWQPLSIIFPDDMAAALFNRGGRVWQHTMFGDKAPDEVLAFWQHCKQHCDWFKGSKCFNYPVLEKLIPFSIYGDDIAAYKGLETGMVTVLGWTSDLAFLNGSWTRYWPITVYAEYAATEWTYNDIMSHVVRRLHGMFDTEVVHDWTADGYMFVMSSLQGDLKFIRDMYHLHDYRANSFCSACGAQKNNDDISMTLADFRPNAAHATSMPDLSAFHQNRTLAA